MIWTIASLLAALVSDGMSSEEVLVRRGLLRAAMTPTSDPLDRLGAYLVLVDEYLTRTGGEIRDVKNGVPVLPGWEVLSDGLPYPKLIIDGAPMTYAWVIESFRWGRPPKGLDESVWTRELRLWACDCAERVQSKDADLRLLQAIEVSRRFAVGDATEQERMKAENAALEAARTMLPDPFDLPALSGPRSSPSLLALQLATNAAWSAASAAKADAVAAAWYASLLGARAVKDGTVPSERTERSAQAVMLARRMLPLFLRR